MHDTTASDDGAGFGPAPLFPFWIEQLPNRGFYVYDLMVDVDVLYVGQSSDVRTRAKTHWRARGRYAFEWVWLHGPFIDRPSCEFYEQRRITQLQPPWNIDGVRRPFVRVVGAGVREG